MQKQIIGNPNIVNPDPVLDYPHTIPLAFTTAKQLMNLHSENGTQKLEKTNKQNYTRFLQLTVECYKRHLQFFHTLGEAPTEITNPQNEELHITASVKTITHEHTHTPQHFMLINAKHSSHTFTFIISKGGDVYSPYNQDDAMEYYTSYIQPALDTYTSKED